MSTDPHRTLGIDDDDVVPFPARPGESMDPTIDPDAVPFERSRHPRDQRPADASSQKPVAGDPPRDLNQESVAAQATHPPAPTPSIPYEPTTASGRAAKQRLDQIDAAQTALVDDEQVVMEEKLPGRRHASPAAIAAICGALALLVVTVIHGGAAGRASAPPRTLTGAAASPPPAVDPLPRSRRNGRGRRSSTAPVLTRTRTVVIVERASATNAALHAAARAAISEPNVGVSTTPACVPGDLGC